MSVQTNLDYIKDNLTTSELNEIRSQLGLIDASQRSRWSRLWKASPIQKQVDPTLLQLVIAQLKLRNENMKDVNNALMTTAERLLDNAPSQV